MGFMVTADDLKRSRQRVKESHEAFARRFGVDRSTYTSWENHGPPREGTAPMLIERILAELAVESAYKPL